MPQLHQHNGYKCVLQASEEDCGAACLAAIAKYYGQFVSLTRSREAVGTGQLGTTLLGLKRGSEALGFNARSVKASPEIVHRIKEVPLPAVIHWQGYHWVVFYGKQGRKFVIADPAVGMRYLRQQEFLAGWNGIMLLLEPDPVRFSEQEEEAVTGFGRFFKRVWPFRSLLIEALLINIVLGLLALASPVLIQILTDDVLVRQDVQLLTVVVIAVILMTLFGSTLRLLQSTMISYFGQKLQLGLVLEFGHKLLRLPLTYYETRRSGEITSRLRDINEINQLVSQVVVMLPSQFFVAIVSLCFMIVYSWKLTVAVIVIAVIMALITLPFLPILRRKTRNLLVLSSENQGVLVETFKGAMVVKSTGAAPQLWEEFQTRFGRLAHVTYSTIQLGIINGTFSQLISSIGGVCLLGFGSLLVIGGEISIGQLLAFNILQGNVLSFIGSIINLVDEYFRAQTAVSRIAEVIDASPEMIGDHHKPTDVTIPGNAEIRFSNLNFHHAGRVSLLDDFSLTLAGGQVIALIGKSGCGKSTLAKLIASLYQPQSGNIRIGHYNLQDLSLDCLRQQVVYVPQEPHFWSRSILDNFRLGTPQVTFEQIVRACQIADADSFISNLPNKYQTVLGEFGANLSGGQRQRLAIARAIVTDPPILILDESTGGLDPVSEAQVLEQLLSHRHGKTTILITHRPSVINRCDWVVLLSQGHLQMQGSLEALRSSPGEHLKFLIPS